MINFRGCSQKLGFTIIIVRILSANLAIAEIAPDSTLPNNSIVTKQDNVRIITGGTQTGKNLFHSFKEFSVPNGSTADFKNTADIQNIISRVTGKSISNIDGILKANGTANLFLINPNGIIFGDNASLNIGGSFLATTASSLNFADGTKFSAIEPQTTALLTVSVPIGLQFGATAAPIRNQSQASLSGAENLLGDPVGLQVLSGKTLALVGGDVTLEGGSLTAKSGRIELGSVAGNSFVGLEPGSQGWVLGYEGVRDFQNILLINGNIGGSEIPSSADTSGKDGSGNIQVRGKSVELIGSLVTFLNLNNGVLDGGDLTINASKLTIRDGAQVLNGSLNQGSAGNLIINASESVDVVGGFITPSNIFPSVLSSGTYAAGKGGDININTSKFRILSGAEVTVEASGIQKKSELIPATGQGGNLNVNASESLEIAGTSANGVRSSRLSALTKGPGDAGKVTIATGQLIVRDQASITISSLVPKDVIYLGDAGNLGKAGNLEVQARSIVLSNQGKLVSETDLGKGGNITLQVQDLLLMRRNSQISTNAGKAQAVGDGGNININAANGFIVANKLENSDITANAFSGSGGKVQIDATGIFGIFTRSREDLARLLGTNDPNKLNPQDLPTSDITAISQASSNLSGTVNIDIPNSDPDRGLINLPQEPTEQKITQSCPGAKAENESSFIITGRGGLPSNPKQFLTSDRVEVGWVEESAVGRQNSSLAPSSYPAAIVEAQRWLLDTNGDINLVGNVNPFPVEPGVCQ
jgi:filamentous hemagglutinin family protein